MRQIFSLIAPNAVVVMIGGAAIALGAGIGQARAADCLAGPNASSPPGQHWYYRIDRATGRHCWYLHALLRTAHQNHGAAALANAKIDAPAPAAPLLAAVAPLPAAEPPPPAPAATDDTPSPPHVTMLAVKTIAVPALDTRAEPRSRHRISEASQAATRAYRAAPASPAAPTTFFFLVFGLGLMTFLMAIVVKRVAPQARWLLWPIRTEADMAWPGERRTYSGAGPARLTRPAWSAHD